MLPALLGVLACFVLPAPLGNPEKSRIDPAMTGIWGTGVDPKGREAWIWIMEPYDRRTWLVTWLFLQPSKSADLDAERTANGRIELASILRGNLLEIDAISFQKAWLTDLDDHQFLIFEPKVLIDSDEPMTPEWWWTMRIRMPDENSLAVDYINPEFDGYDDALKKFGGSISRDQIGKIYERVIRKNMDNTELFMQAEKFASRFNRLPTDDYKYVNKILKSAGISTELDF